MPLLRTSLGLRLATALVIALLAAGAVLPPVFGQSSVLQVAAAARVPATGAWQKQSPLPTGVTLNNIDMISATEGWVGGQQGVILHTTDSGLTWTVQNSGTTEPIYDVRFLDAQHGWASSNNTVLYTTNGGATWQQGSGVVGSIYNVEFATLTNGFAAYGGNTIFQTTNGGVSWTQRSMPAIVGSVQFFDASNGIASSTSGVFHTANGGATWTLTAGSHGGFFINPNEGWYVNQNVAEHTTNGGASWQPQTVPSGTWNYTVTFTDALHGWAAGDTIIRTTDGGTTWTTAANSGAWSAYVPFWGIDFTDAAHGIVVGIGGHIFGTTDGGGTWVRRSHGDGVETLNFAVTDATHVWASTSSGKVLYTTDGGQDWAMSPVGDTGAVLHGIAMADNQTGWTVGESGTGGTVFRTSDGGHSWQQQNEGTGQRLFAVAALNPQVVMAVGGGTQFTVARRSTDGGATWTGMPVPIGDSIYLDISFVNSTTGWIVGLDGGIAKTTDGGVTWAAQAAPQTYGLFRVRFADPNNGWAGGYFQKLLHTTNGGQTWVAQDPGIPDRTHVLAVSAVSPTVAWIAGYGGGAQSVPFVKYTTDGGATWIEQTPTVGPYDGFAAVAFLTPDYGWAGGFAGIWQHGTGQGGPTPTSAPATSTPVAPTATRTTAPPSATGTVIAPTATRTAAPPATGTVIPPTATRTVVPPSATRTVPPGVTQTPAPPSATPTVCTLSFIDVPSDNPFYPAIRCLACRGILSGYQDGTFRPFTNVTRGQTAKIVSNAAGLQESIPADQQTFSDVPSASPFWVWIERLAGRGIISGYTCGGPGEPCDPQSRQYFRAGNDVTRAQLAKIVANTAGYTETLGGQTFADVSPADAFYVYIERVVLHGVLSGYTCGGPGEPCDPQTRPYFRGGSPATRGQTAKIVANAFLPNCQTPAR
jgi:photosystem II stability/assembly factor-like uncharacterized protein